MLMSRGLETRCLGHGIDPHQQPDQQHCQKKVNDHGDRPAILQDHQAPCDKQRKRQAQPKIHERCNNNPSVLLYKG
jgi:hypothetical protein